MTEPTTVEPTNETSEKIEDYFGVELDEPINATDSDGDGKADTLNDPNGVLTQVNDGLTINGNAAILISTDDDDIPEFFWDTETNEITNITHAVGETSEPDVVDAENETVTITISVEKSDWIYIDITDSYPEETYPGYTLTIQAVENGVTRIISSDMIWRKDGKIYILDDPATEYQVVYAYNLLPPTVDPESGSTTTEETPTITVTYHELVTTRMITFKFKGETIDYIGTKSPDEMVYTFTPKFNLTEDGILELFISVNDTDGNIDNLTATLTVDLADVVDPPVAKEDEPEGEIPWLLVAVIVIVMILLFIFYLFKSGYLYVEYEEPEKVEFEKVKEKKPVEKFEKIDEKKTSATKSKKTSSSKKGSAGKGKNKKK